MDITTDAFKVPEQFDLGNSVLSDEEDVPRKFSIFQNGKFSSFIIIPNNSNNLGIFKNQK